MRSTYEEIRRVMKYIGDPDIDDYVKDRLSREKNLSFWFEYVLGICMCALVVALAKLLLQ